MVLGSKRLGWKIEAKRLGGKRLGRKRLGGETSCDHPAHGCESRQWLTYPTYFFFVCFCVRMRDGQTLGEAFLTEKSKTVDFIKTK